MNAYYAGLPSDLTMKQHCHSSPNRWLLWQTVGLQSGLSLLFFALSAIHATLSQCFSFITGRGLTLGDSTALQEWFLSTASFAFCSALMLVTLVIFVRYYLRSQFGAPTYYAELQADLSQESVMEVSRVFLTNNSLEQTLLVDPASGRMLGLIAESGLSSTYLEITTIEMEPNRTWIGVRGASIVYGKAKWLSAFYTDQGAARQIGLEVIDMFTPYASRKRSPGQNPRASQQALPVIRLVDDCPPPLSTAHRLQRFGGAGRRY